MEHGCRAGSGLEWHLALQLSDYQESVEALDLVQQHALAVHSGVDVDAEAPPSPYGVPEGVEEKSEEPCMPLQADATPEACPQG